MTRAELIALGLYISEWPEDKSYMEILDVLYNCHVNLPDEYSTCEFYEDWYPPLIAERVEELKKDIDIVIETEVSLAMIKEQRNY